MQTHRITILVLLFLGILVIQLGQRATAAQGGNSVANPSFESQPSICDTGQSGCSWKVYRDARSTPADATVTADQAKSEDGNYSAKIDMTISNPIGFIGLYQIPPFPQGTLRFSNLTSNTNSLDFWLYIQPKYTGTAGVVVRVLSMSAKELDYAIDTNPGLSYFNNTSGNPPTATIKLDNLPADQWDHFTRDLQSDWQTFYNLNETISWIEFDSLYFEDYQSKPYSETTWIDLVQMLYGPGTTAQPPIPPTNPPHGPTTPFTMTSYNWAIIATATIISLLTIVGLLRHRNHRSNISPTVDFQSPPVES